MHSVQPGCIYMIRISDSFSISEQELLTGRCCIIGQSGSGKSFLVGVIAEELAMEHLPFAIIDTEGEYRSLKSMFDVLWVSDDAEADLGFDVDFPSLIEKSMLGIPIVFDVSGRQDQAATVYRFLEELYRIEDRERKPYLAIVEEADKFAPQVKRGELNILEEISVRGRKRGLGILVATQRPANISKNVLAQCSYGFIGKLSIENDVNAVSILFEDRNELRELVSLHTGEFMPFGINAPPKIKVRSRTVAHISSTPELSALPGEDISKAISELKVSSGEAMRSSAHTAAYEKARVFPERFGIDYARAYASRASRTILPFRGFMVDSVEPRYIAVAEMLLRIPSKRANVYTEKHLLAFGNNILAATRRGFKVLEIKKQRVDKLSAAILSDVISKGSLSQAYIQNKFDGGADRSIDLLSKSDRASYSKGKLRPGGWFSFLSDKQYEVSDGKLQKATLIKPKSKTAPKDLVSSLIPGGKLMSIDRTYLKLYEITLRRGSTVKVILLDSFAGREIRL